MATTQCLATTKKGLRCRNLKTVGKYCYIHRNLVSDVDSSESDSEPEIIVRPKTPFIVFSMMTTLKQDQFPDVKTFLCEVQRLWKELPENERDKWKDLAIRVNDLQKHNNTALSRKEIASLWGNVVSPQTPS
jgi:hypothetical protein